MIFRLIFLIIFLIIGALFASGSLLLPILTIKNDYIENDIYINKIESKIILTPEEQLLLSQNKMKIDINTTSYYKDLNIDSKFKMALEYLYYGCIITSCLIGGGIIFAYLRMKFISKILFILAQTFMTTFVTIIVILYYSSSFSDNIIQSLLPQNIPQQFLVKFKNLKTAYGSGGMLIIISSIMMIVNYLIYSFIG